MLWKLFIWKALWPVAGLVVALVNGSAALAQDKQSVEKSLPDDLYGEWCFAEPDDPQSGTNYRLPSWADKCDKDKILSIGRQWIESGDTYCQPISKIKTKVECAPSGCQTSATFRGTARPNFIRVFGARIWRMTEINLVLNFFHKNLPLSGFTRAQSSSGALDLIILLDGLQN